ncbi:MAG: bi-domain-containing oxidoreductase [Burkholderiales bacterium]|nr:bi-domain-containing oxidoreductase [Burkholderiales bacterium]
MRSASMPLWKRALAQPAKVRAIAELAVTQGPAAALERVRGKLAEPVALGYSAAGRVLAAGAGVTAFRVGDAVAVAGAQCAFHAEILNVPQQLAAAVPDNVDLGDAATVALGAIALQGVRRAEPTLGETVAVIGLGVLGQLTVQILKAAGARVLALDVDPARIALAASLGADAPLVATDAAPDQVRRLCGGHGADAVIITASAADDTIVAQAFGMSRRKGRVVLVGDVGLDLKRADLYAKELDFRISCSYGPGRYDADYEERGVDYPLAYVRWTENRNMAAYLRLLETGAVRVGEIIGGRHRVEEAEAVYAALRADRARLLALFDFGPADRPSAGAVPRARPTAAARPGGTIGIGVIGAGQYTRAMHLPLLRELADHFCLRGVAMRTGHKAAAVAAEFGAAFATTDADAVLADPETQAVLIATRHDLHARLAQRALAAGKHVLVEKPLALSASDLEGFDPAALAASGAPVLQTGFNRRFSPHAAQVRELVAQRAQPLMLSYRMNAGYIPAEHWVHGPEGGGRNLGEACHAYDLFSFLIGTAIERVEAVSIGPGNGHYRRDDNFCATLRYADGSIATLLYTAMGSADHPKEQMELFCDGRVIRLDDYRTLTVAGDERPLLSTRTAEKGQREQWLAFAQAVRTGNPAIPVAEQIAAVRVALAVQDRLFA